MTDRQTFVDDESEAGMAMITAIMVCMVVLFLGMTSVSLSDHSFSSQRVDRKRVAVFHAAEAGIDHALQILQSTTQASLPCATPLAASLGSGAGSGDYSVMFQYFDAAGAAMTCPLTAVPRSVLLSSVGDSNEPLGSSRKVQVTAQLSAPASTTAFDKVVFSDASVSFDERVTIRGYSGNDAVVYTNGDYTCDNIHQLAGYVYAQGVGHLGNRCTVRADIWTKGAITMDQFAVVDRDAISGTSSIAMDNQAKVRRNARAGTTITTSGSASVDGLRIPNSPAGDPPSSSFPEVPYTQSAWVAAGYTIRPYTDCNLAANDLRTLSATWADPTVVRITGCRLDLSTSSTIRLNDHLAVISDQGIRFTQQTTWRVDSGTHVRELHLIVPHGVTCSTSEGNIEMLNSFAIDPPIRTLVYTPCELELRNSGVLEGQFYGGALEFGQATNLRYVPVSGIPGYSASTTTSLVRQVVVLYKREVSG